MKLSESIELIRPCIVQIALVAEGLSGDSREMFNTDNIELSIGTGFYVNRDGYAITANHVITKGNEEISKIQAENKSLKIGVAQPNELARQFPDLFEPKMYDWRANFTFTEFDIVDQDEKSDLVLLKMEKNPFSKELTSGRFVEEKEVPLLYGTAHQPMAIEGRPPDGSRIAISGFPLGQPILFTTCGIIASSWYYEIRKRETGIIPKHVPLEIRQILAHELVDAYYGDIETYPGHSGAPVYFIEDGKIIGVCVSNPLLEVIDENLESVSLRNRKIYFRSGITQIVPIYLVNRLLIRNGILWAPPSS